jgi:hypothetical protein
MSAAAPSTHPEGPVCRTGLIGPDEQAELLELLDGLELHEIRMRGQVARRIRPPRGGPPGVAAQHPADPGAAPLDHPPRPAGSALHHERVSPPSTRTD